MLHKAHAFVLCLTFVKLLHAVEWIEITQKVPENSLKPNIKFMSNVTASNVFDNTTPSPYWLEYQKERFSNQDRMHGTQKLVVTAGHHLKNSAKVIVTPMTVITSTSKVLLPHEEIIRTKMQLNVVNNKLEAANTEHAHVEMTSRKYTPLHDNDDNSHETSDQEQNENNSDMEVFPTIQGFLSFIKSIKKEWLKKAAMSINQKIKLLEMLRDNLMYTIEERFMAIWHPQRANRQKRGLLDEANFEFPPEAALMSINFLTFAVFLIKLVLNVVNIIKSKHYNFTGFGTSDVVRNPT